MLTDFFWFDFYMSLFTFLSIFVAHFFS
jgi:hypothetical protein